LIYKQQAHKYLQLGFAAIPTHKENAKHPEINAWTAYSQRLPTEEEVDTWVKTWPDSNLSIVLGKASGIVALDIDTDDEFVLNLLPASPCRKRGALGETRFFLYTEGLKTKRVQGVVELLSDGTHTVMPGSIHPKGMVYEYLTDVGLDRDNLEELPADIYEIMESLKGTKAETEATKGRKMAIYVQVAHAIENGKTNEVILNEIKNYEEKHHSKSWFYDEEEKDSLSMKGPEFFIEVVRKSKGIPNPNVFTLPNVSKILEADDQKDEEYKTHVETLSSEIEGDDDSFCPIPYEPLPIPQEGLMSLLYKAIRSNTYKDISPIAVAGAVAITDVLFSRKIRFFHPTSMDLSIKEQDIWPHSYNLCFAKSGKGKDAPSSFFDKLRKLIPELNKKVGECGSISTAPGLYDQLKDKPTTFYKDDEIGTLFHSINEYKRKDLALALCDAYTKCRGIMHGNVTRGTKKAGDLPIHNPALIMLGFTTKEAFEKSAGNEINDWGLIPRMNIFTMNNWKESERLLITDDEYFSLVSTVQLIITRMNSLTVREVDDKWLRNKYQGLDLSQNAEMIVPHEAIIKPGLMKKLIEPYELWADSLAESLGPGHIAQRTLERATERSMIGAFRNALSRFDWTKDNGNYITSLFSNRQPNIDAIEIDEKDINEGIKLFKHSVCNLCTEGKTLKIDSVYARLYEQIKQYIMEAGIDGILHGTITNRVRSKDRNAVLQDLIFSGQVLQYKSRQHGKRRKYVWASHIRAFENKWREYERI
jgi:hypothetical protein